MNGGVQVAPACIFYRRVPRWSISLSAPPTKQYRHLAIVYGSCIGTCACSLPQKRNNRNITAETFSEPVNHKCGHFSSNRWKQIHSNIKLFVIIGCVFLQSEFFSYKERANIFHNLTKTNKSLKSLKVYGAIIMKKKIHVFLRNVTLKGSTT